LPVDPPEPEPPPATTRYWIVYDDAGTVDDLYVPGPVKVIIVLAPEVAVV
jgi:hypothetical protein